MFVLWNKQQSSDKKYEEENSRRIDLDADDHRKIKDKKILGKCINPLEINSHLSNVLINIYT